MTDIKHDDDWLIAKLRKLYDGASKKAKLDDDKFLSFAEIAVSICKAYYIHMKSNEWIPMSTPPEDGQVVDVTVLEHGHMRRFTDVRYSSDTGVFMYVKIGHPTKFRKVDNVTHWMPAPTLPETDS